jgi:hypothetical protein
LLTVGPLIPRVAALGLRIALHLSFEISRGQIVQVHGVIQAKQALLSCSQLALNQFTMGMKSIQVAVQSFIAQGGKIRDHNVGQRGVPDPIGHGMLGQREDQTIQRHDFTQQTGAIREPRGKQDLVQSQLPPYLMPDMNGSCFAGFLQAHSLRVDGHQGFGFGTGCRRARLWSPPPFFDHAFERRIGSSE